MEAEARAILEASCKEPVKTSALSLPEWVDQLYGDKKPKGVADDLIAERRREARREEREYRRK